MIRPRILMVDDHAMVREGVRLLLHKQGLDCELLEANTCAAALALLAQQGNVDWVLLDLGLPDVSGIETLSQLRTNFPHVPVVVLSASEDRPLVLECINGGAMGFIAKSSNSAILVNALRLVFAGGVYLPPSVLGHITPIQSTPTQSLSPQSIVDATQNRLTGFGLTGRQIEVLDLLVQGLPNKLIAKRLDLSEATVKTHVAAALKTLNVRNRTQAVFAVAKLGSLLDSAASRAGHA
jgi:DNA-binding NarL/FixJ family response regulator